VARVRRPISLTLAAILPGVAACSFFAPSYAEFANDPGSSGTGATGNLGGDAYSPDAGAAGSGAAGSGGAGPASFCHDGQTGENETGLDCGGLCPPCDAGQGCVDTTDCTSKVCTQGVCQAANCQDSVQNGDETAVDCGGVCPTRCDVGQGCQSPYDCRTSVCAGTCQAASCTDGTHNGDESAIDCGGSCDPCPNGQPCLQPSDCRSGSCSHDICVNAGCTDQIKNGNETGVDCGGSCAPCSGNAACSANSDCASLICDGTSHSCTIASCTDGVLNGAESDIDCGAGCPGCANGKNCARGGDCSSGLCKSGVCVPTSPSGVKLSRTGWTVTASSAAQNDVPFAIDGNPQTRWTTGLYQAPGMWFKIDMQQPRLFFTVVLDAQNEPPDAPVLFDVYLSNDGNFSMPTKVGQQGAPLTTIDFGGAQLVRYVYIVLRGSKSGNWWSIDEVNAFR
jgi:hypothetical protein